MNEKKIELILSIKFNRNEKEEITSHPLKGNNRSKKSITWLCTLEAVATGECHLIIHSFSCSCFIREPSTPLHF